MTLAARAERLEEQLHGKARGEEEAEVRFFSLSLCVCVFCVYLSKCAQPHHPALSCESFYPSRVDPSSKRVYDVRLASSAETGVGRP